MDMKKLIQQMTDLESKSSQLTEAEMPYSTLDTGMGQQASGSPLNVNVSMTASGKEHVSDLLSLMKNAGLTDAAPVAQDNIPMRQDMDRLRGIVDTDDTMHDDSDETPCDSSSVESDEEILDDYSNEPEPEYQDHNYMTKDLSGGLNREKGSYAAAQAGDNAMNVKEIAKQLYDALAEKKAKPDFLDIDDDGDTKEPMKKAANDKKKGSAKNTESQVDEISADTMRRYKDKAQSDASAKNKDLRTRVKPHQQPQGDDAELDRKVRDRRDQVSKASKKIAKKDTRKPRKVSTKNGLGGVGPVDRYV